MADYEKYNLPSSLLKFDREEINQRDNFWNMQQKLMIDHYDKITKQKDELIKSKLSQKGFGHLIQGIEKARFPKICFIKSDNWTYIYADNDTKEGAFIVAIQDFNYGQDYSDKDFSISMIYSFNWQDTRPLPLSKK